MGHIGLGLLSRVLHNAVYSCNDAAFRSSSLKDLRRPLSIAPRVASRTDARDSRVLG